MLSVIAVFGIAIALLGAMGIVYPTGLTHFVAAVWETLTGFYLAITVRFSLGVILIVAAPDCRFPVVVRALGIVSLIAAAATAILGYERLRSFVQWWVGRPAGFIRGWATAAVVFGGFLVYAAS